MYKILAIAVLTASLAGCIDPQQYEATPVQVSSPQGVVTCQFYTQTYVLWDRAVDFPQTMTLAQADNICKAEGERRR